MKKNSSEKNEQKHVPKLVTGALLTCLSSSCGKGLPSSVSHQSLPSFSVEVPCTTACFGTTDAVAINDPTGDGTSGNPLTASLCSQDENSYTPLVVDVANASALNCTATDSEIDVQIQGATKLAIKAASPVAPESFNCEASNADGNTTFYFSLDSSSCSCFTAETKVLMADGSFKNIVDLREGDEIRGSNGATNTIMAIEVHSLNRGVLYSLNGSIPFVTASHPFLTKDGWKAIDPALASLEWPEAKIGQLAANDVLVLDQGKTLFLEAVTKAAERENLKVYNLLTSGDETYLVAIQDCFAVVHS